MPRESLFTSTREVQSLDRPQSLWNKLAIQTRQQDPFCCSSSWHLSFHDAFGPKRRLLIRHSNDSLVAFAEKTFSPGNIYLTPIESLWFFGNNVLGPQGVNLLRDTLIDIQRHYAPTFPKIVISAIPPRGAVYKELQENFVEQFAFYRHSLDIQCAASLAGGFDGFLSRRSANHRRNMKKQGKGPRSFIDQTLWPEFQDLSAALSAYLSEITEKLIREEVHGETSDAEERDGRIIAICFKGSEDLNRWMVASGWAVAYRKYSLDYVAVEERAHLAKAGIWSGTFKMPWDWRTMKK